MLLKWIVLIVIAWYVFRAAGNLIAAARGGQPPLEGQPRSGHAPPGNQDGPPIRVVRKRSAQASGAAATKKDDVEDARFTDL